MAVTVSLFASAIGTGYRASRYGDFVILTMQAAGFAVPARDLQAAEAWARSRSSLGSTHRDRTAFVDRFETILVRSGSGYATKGSMAVLKRLVHNMEQAGIDIKDYSVPHNVNESVEVKKPKAPPPAGSAAADAVAAAATAAAPAAEPAPAPKQEPSGP